MILVLSPEERQHIYEEEKARLEAESEAKHDSNNTIGLAPNLAGLLCYLGMWVTGIVFLVLEQKNRFIRFHAAQAIVVFGVLTLMSSILRLVPVAGGLFAAAVGVMMFVLWLVLMVKAYRGELYRIPLAAELADMLLNTISSGATRGTTHEVAVQTVESNELTKSSRSSTGDIVGSVLAIIFSLVMLIFLNVFYTYIAYYSLEDGILVRQQSLVTAEWQTWLPVVNIAIAFSIIGYIVSIIYRRKMVREAVRIVIDVFSVIVIGSLLSVFPFDFHPLPVSASLVAFSVRLGLSIAVVAVTVAVVVRSIRLLIAIIRS